MCTVTFIPTSDSGFILTSNRDEAPDRETLPPQVYDLDEAKVLFPKDERAGGTWLGVSSRDRWICLLNGGFEAHERATSYRMSRGKIVTHLLGAPNAIEEISSYSFSGIEPFTIVLVEGKAEVRIYELVWDGETVHFSEKPKAPQIWSSSLLYPKAARQKREQWFSEFLFNSLRPSPSEVLHFHRTAGEGDAYTDLIMDKGFVKTTSISLFCKTEEETYLRYEDLKSQLVSTTPF